MVARMSFSYPDEYKEKLLILAEKNRRSLSGYVQNVLAEHLESKGFKINFNPKKKGRPKNDRVKRNKGSAAGRRL